MAHFIPNRRITEHLLEQGLVPANCRTADLHFEPDGAVVLRYEVFVTDDDLAKLQRAIAKTLEPES
jgi:hypothetical protein